MKCADCGGDITSTRENHRYRECGLDNVLIKNAEIRVCRECGGRELVLPRIEELHRVIAHQVSEKPERLDPREIRFLRKYLGLSSVDFARRMGVSAETVTRWESTKIPTRMKLGLERYLRLMVLNEKPTDYYPLEKLDALAVKNPAANRINITQRRQEWAVSV